MVSTVSSPRDPLVDLRLPQPAFWPLRRFSDFLFLAHNNLCDESRACLRRLEWVIHGLVVGEAEDVVSHLMGTTDDGDSSLPDDGGSSPSDEDGTLPWPGKEFIIGPVTPNVEDQAPVALVGCPNGYGTGYLLAQHNAEYGGKTIDRVRVFSDDMGELGIAWHITDL